MFPIPRTKVISLTEELVARDCHTRRRWLGRRGGSSSRLRSPSPAVGKSAVVGRTQRGRAASNQHRRRTSPMGLRDGLLLIRPGASMTSRARADLQRLVTACLLASVAGLVAEGCRRSPASTTSIAAGGDRSASTTTLPSPNAPESGPIIRAVGDFTLPQSWTACQQDDDCTMVTLGCCDETAVHRAYAARLRQALEDSGRPYCPPKSACGPGLDGTWNGANAACTQGVCRKPPLR